ncbi:hypothetical protein ASPBRDRAFT_354651 [Aspergillus brasiliensis CBS 101740]|uniref:Uncharacterized protein n=1 Tax=Aspergillus brasiliensis (strain CBS 101740 / IMI 381727 / IBT 21946) TaxID=767769 RepID=A0A1L9U5A6_ASPBC|nr:hypothetical protein ASPBRDRAFT_354651 [Aspergillus brasiliensis CBS 101740]
MPPVGKGSGKYRHVFDGDVPPFPCGSPPTCTSLSPSRITTAAPLAFSRLRPLRALRLFFSLPVFFSTLVPPSVDDSPSHNTNRKFARPPDLLYFHSQHSLSYHPLPVPSLSHNLLFFFLIPNPQLAFRSDRLSFCHLTLVSFLCYSSSSGVAYCRDS